MQRFASLLGEECLYAADVLETRLVYHCMAAIEKARAARSALRAFLLSLGDVPVAEYATSSSAAQRAIEAFEHDFDLGNERAIKQTSALRKAQKAAAYLRTKIRRLAKQVKESNTSKVGGRLEKIWLIRAGLSDPYTPVRTMAQFFEDWPKSEFQAVSVKC